MLGLGFALLYLCLFVGPFVLSLDQSTQSPLTGRFVGSGNYRTVLSNANFWDSIRRVAGFTVLQVLLLLVLSAGLALLLDSQFARGRAFFQAVFLLPYAVPGVIAAIMWAFMLSPETNALWTKLGVQPLTDSTVFFVLIVIVTWEWTGYSVVLFLAALTSVPKDVIEAARLDGCGELWIALSIKLRMISGVVMFVGVTSALGAFQLFSEPNIISFIHPLPANYTPNLLAYKTAFSFGDIPAAAAQSMILALITVTIGLLGLLGVRAVRTRGRRG